MTTLALFLSVTALCALCFAAGISEGRYRAALDLTQSQVVRAGKGDALQ